MLSWLGSPSQRPSSDRRRTEDSSREANRSTKSSRIPKPRGCTSEPRRSHPSVRARNRNRGNPLPTRNSYAERGITFRELWGQSVDVDGAIADPEDAIVTPTADPRWDKQEHRQRVAAPEWPVDRARGRSWGLMRAETGSRRRSVSQRAAITDGRSPVTSVSAVGCRSRGQDVAARVAGRRCEAGRDRSREDFQLPLRVPAPSTPDLARAGRLADREIDTRDTKFFTLTGRFSRRPRPIFIPPPRVASRRACRPLATHTMLKPRL